MLQYVLNNYFLLIVKRFDHIIGKRYISTCYVCMCVCVCVCVCMYMYIYVCM